MVYGDEHDDYSFFSSDIPGKEHVVELGTEFDAVGVSSSG